MNINTAFPSDYLKSEDLQGRDVTLTIEKVELEKIGQGRDSETKPIIYFVGKKKAMVANKTNCKTIAKLYGDETTNWIGKPITIGPREVEFQGDMVWAIRVSLKKPVTATQQAAPVAAPAKPAPMQAHHTGATAPTNEAGEVNFDETDSVPF